jgi:predicted transposase/invertase (TIGR01784 family)
LGAEQRGIQAEKISIAKKMKAHGDSIEYIAEMTGLSINEINKL